MRKILVVDDRMQDLCAVKQATEFSLRVLELTDDFSVIVALSADEARAVFDRERPSHVVTDLFMPSGDFTDLDARCDEMEFPKGLELLDYLTDKPAAVLVTTFYWQYPGFLRYVDYVRSRRNAVGSIPKDLFFLAGRLERHQNCLLTDYAFSTPFCILIQAMGTFLQPPPKTGVGLQLTGLYFSSLTEQASNWLSLHPSQVFESREMLTVGDGNCSGTTMAGEISAVRSRRGSLERGIAEQLAASRWMPSFAVHSAQASYPMQRGWYRALMSEVAAPAGWSLQIVLPSEKTEQHGYIAGELVFGQKKIKYHTARHQHKTLSIDDFLKPGKEQHTRFAQLLLTLGFFTYWCHIPEYRSALTSLELAQVIEQRGGTKYGHDGDKEYDRRKAAELIEDDLEDLMIKIDREIKANFETEWYDQLKNYTVIGKKKIGDKKSEYYNRFCYWLNASLDLPGTTAE